MPSFNEQQHRRDPDGRFAAMNNSTLHAMVNDTTTKPTTTISQGFTNLTIDDDWQPIDTNDSNAYHHADFAYRNTRGDTITHYTSMDPDGDPEHPSHNWTAKTSDGTVTMRISDHGRPEPTKPTLSAQRIEHHLRALETERDQYNRTRDPHTDAPLDGLYAEGDGATMTVTRMYGRRPERPNLLNLSARRAWAQAREREQAERQHTADWTVREDPRADDERG